LLFGLVPALLGGCLATHLLYVSDTVLGIDVAASAEGTGHLIFGYDRETFALVPRKEDAQTDAKHRFDAMSLAAVSCVYADGLEAVRFNHFIATGQSAKYVAKDPDGYARIRDAIFGPKTTLPEETPQNGGATNDQPTKEMPSCD